MAAVFIFSGFFYSIKAPLWSEKRSHSCGLSEEQAYGHED
jgi:hypothetical protein